MTDRVKELLDLLVNGDRGGLARCITLLESRRPIDEADQISLLQACDDIIATRPGISQRVAFTGPPGVGKSSLINRYGLRLIRDGHRVAVLAIDPTSKRTGGSILGDKTRMADLSRHENAFIRPSATSGHLGGTAETTREAILVCEAAGYDRILVETVGVGQSEHDVSQVVDLVVFVTMARSGDGLQGIKRGILEMVDLVAVNKAEDDGRQAALNHARELGSALKLLRGAPAPACIPTSAISGLGVDELSNLIDRLLSELVDNGSLDEQRQNQRIQWFEMALNALLQRRIRDLPEWKTHHARLKDEVTDGTKTPYAAARELLERLAL